MEDVKLETRLSSKEIRALLHSMANDIFVIQGAMYLILRNEQIISDEKLSRSVDRAVEKSNNIMKNISEFRERNLSS